MMTNDEFWDELLAGPPIADSNALCEQIADLLDGDNITWIKRTHQTGFLTVSELLALVLYQVRKTDHPVRDEKKVIVNWAKLVREALRKEQITVLDPDSHTPVSSQNQEGWNWETSLHYADLFFKQNGTGWLCSQIVKKLLQAKKGKGMEDALKIDFLKLIALFATDEAYGFDASKYSRAVSRVERDLQTVGFTLGDDRIRTYLKQAVTQDVHGLPMSTILKLAIGLAIALHGYDPQSPEKSLSKIEKDNKKRGISGLKTGNIRKLLELASQKIPSKPA